MFVSPLNMNGKMMDGLAYWTILVMVSLATAFHYMIFLAGVGLERGEMSLILAWIGHLIRVFTKNVPKWHRLQVLHVFKLV